MDLFGRKAKERCRKLEMALNQYRTGRSTILEDLLRALNAAQEKQLTLEAQLKQALTDLEQAQRKLASTDLQMRRKLTKLNLERLRDLEVMFTLLKHTLEASHQAHEPAPARTSCKIT